MDIPTILMILFLVGLIVLLVVSIRRRSVAMRDVPLSEKFNTLATLSFVLAFFVSIAAIVLGHIVLSQINRTRERGWGLALAGTIIGYVGLVAGAIVVAIWASTFAPFM